MPTRNINLTPEMNRFVDTQIQNGRYANASEVLRAGLRALEEDEKEDQARLEALRMAIEAGEESGVAEGDVFEEVRSYIRQLAAEKGKVA
jgi:antitoxin ParD1/3/4